MSSRPLAAALVRWRALRRALALLFVLALLAACSIPYPPCDLQAILYPGTGSLRGGSLRLGVIDASRTFPFDLPEPLSQTGASLAVLDDVRWGFIEPQAPQEDVHDYEWDNETAALDTRVEEYQRAGFQLVMVLRAWNPWARAVSPQGGQAASAASTPPQAPFMADYAAWVAAVVERYDGDGIEDAPNLVDVDGDGAPDPVRYYQIESEVANGVWWQGVSAQSATDEYIALLRTAAAAARGAYDGVRILAAGLPALDLLDGFPTAAGLEDVVSNIHPSVCGAIGAFSRILAAADAYDIVSVHSLADYTGLATLGAWIATLAGPDAEVWINGATSAPALLGDPRSLGVNPLFPTRGDELWSTLKDPSDPGHEAVSTWYRREQARLAFKKWVYAAVYGFEALVAGLEQDRPLLENPALEQRDLAFQGLLEEANGFEPPSVRPVAPALALAQAQLGGYSEVQRLEGLDGGVEGFRFLVSNLPVYVLWLDDGVAQGPEDPSPQRQFNLAVQAPQLTVFTIPTEPGQEGPTIDVLPASDGRLALTLSETPVILRGEWGALYLPRVRR